jgi:hypothetical protein
MTNREQRLKFWNSMENVYLKSVRQTKVSWVPGIRSHNANRLAKWSLCSGLLAVCCMMIPSVTLVLVIPLAITAIVFGKMALQKRTSREMMAKTGKSFGIWMLYIFGLEMLIALFLLAIRNKWI